MARRARFTITGLALLAALLGGPAGAELHRVGSATASQAAGHRQFAHSMLRLADDSFVVVWESQGQDGSGWGVYARRFLSDGSPAGDEFLVNTTTAGDQDLLGRGYRDAWRGPAAARAADGSFVVLFFVADGPRARAFHGDGTPKGPEFRLEFPPVPAGPVLDAFAVAPDGRIAVLYHLPSLYPQFAVHFRYFASDGTADGAETVVAAPSPIHWNGSIGLAFQSDGTAVVEWERENPDDHPDVGAPYTVDLFLARIAPDGSVLANEVSVPPATFDYFPGDLHLLVDRFDRVLVSWSTRWFDLGPVHIRRFEADLTAPVDIAVSSPDLPLLALERSNDGHLLAVSGGSTTYDQSAALLAQVYDEEGVAVGDPRGIHDDLSYGHSMVTAGLGDDGNAVFLGTEIAPTDPAFPAGPFTEQTDFDVQLTRMCSDHGSCDYCAGHDDSVDTDADGVPDGCDACVNPGSLLDATLSRVSVSRNPQTEIPARDNTVTMRQKFTLGTGTPFATLPVDTEGMRIRLESPSGQSLVDEWLPGGAYLGPGTRGWVRKDRKLTYLDRTGSPINGFRTVVLKDFSASVPGEVRLMVRATAGRYAAHAEFVPMKATLVFGDAGSAFGTCIEAAFSGEECTRKGSGSSYDYVALLCAAP